MPERTAELWLRVVPRASAASVGPWHDGVLDVRVTRPPVDGQATDAALRAVAQALDVPLTAIRLAGGRRSRHKQVAVIGLTNQQLAERLSRLGRGPD